MMISLGGTAISLLVLPADEENGKRGGAGATIQSAAVNKTWRTIKYMQSNSGKAC